MTNTEITNLIKTAYEAQENAYAPYSHFHVGAALLTTSGTIYTGCNIENAAFSPTNCAERTAFFKAISEGEREFQAIAIVGNSEGEQPSPTKFTSPCGVCRQVMMEFCDPKTFQVILASTPEHYKIYTLEELLPLGFGPNKLNN